MNGGGCLRFLCGDGLFRRSGATACARATARGTTGANASLTTGALVGDTTATLIAGGATGARTDATAGRRAEGVRRRWREQSGKGDACKNENWFQCSSFLYGIVHSDAVR